MKPLTFVMIFYVNYILAVAQSEEYWNNGEDVTRPITRIDGRLKYQTGVNEPGGKAVIFTLRKDVVRHLSNSWQISLRGDLPYEWYYFSGKHPKNVVNGKKLDHLADSLVQGLIITPSFGKWTYGFGAQVIFPTAGDNLQVGDGKYQLLPTAAMRYDLGFWKAGAYVGLLVRHAFDVAGYKSAPHISQTYFQPFLNINLPAKWFLSFSPELRYDWMIRDWFVPFDIMIGKMITDKIILSIEYENAIVYDFEQYQQQVELRVGYFF